MHDPMYLCSTHFKLLWTILFLSVASNNNNVNIYSSVSTLLKDYKLSKVSCHCWLCIKTPALEPRRHRNTNVPDSKRNFALTQGWRRVLESGGGGWEELKTNYVFLQISGVGGIAPSPLLPTALWHSASSINLNAISHVSHACPV